MNYNCNKSNFLRVENFGLAGNTYASTIYKNLIRRKKVTGFADFSVHWVFAYFGHFFENYKSMLSWASFSTQCTSYVHTYSFWQNMRWATFWASYFTNSSGHPAKEPQQR
jgi:hypothetical protein